ncbi:response regulator [Moritella sp.]|uniref:response regulator n=1 Tax=Moritella sp. TaxID=78556 RepID=UPI0025D677BF|nr:response regulator [Moritella sp.]MCJ8349045.1 response regulator [Moritella sp.]
MSQQSVIQVALIEDDEIVRLAISQRLQLAGYDVIECADGESALILIPTTFPGIVISDVRLPDISGLALTWPDVPLVERVFVMLSFVGLFIYSNRRYKSVVTTPAVAAAY